MPYQSSWRAFRLACLLAFWTVGAVFAHALPGSILTFSQVENELTLSLNLPLEDLALASSALGALEEAALDTALSADHVEPLADYLAEHVAVQHDATDVPLTIKHAMLQTARNEHVGQYVLVVFGIDRPCSDERGCLPADADL